MTNSHKTVQSGLNLHLRDTQEHHMYKGLINVTFKSKLVTFPVSMPDVLDCGGAVSLSAQGKLSERTSGTCRAASVVSRTERPQPKPQQLNYALLS